MRNKSISIKSNLAQEKFCECFNADFFQAMKLIYGYALTYPPYWGLRDYGIEGQIGLESSLKECIGNIVAVFREAKRALAPGGVLRLSIGDGYTSGSRGYRAPDKKNPARAMQVRPGTPEGLKPKDLIGVPWRLAFARTAGA
jgi:site-specific DNA-methyltransferase (adenine-specific)